IDPDNSSCFGNQTENETKFIYNGTTTLESSLTILANALKSNQSYQFKVSLANIQNSSIQAIGYLHIQVTNASQQLIGITCIITTLCDSYSEYQFVTRTAQVALFFYFNITWNIYQGMMNNTSGSIVWTPPLAEQHNIKIFGFSVIFFKFNEVNVASSNTTNFTSNYDLFISNPSIYFWRFEVVYSTSSATSSSVIDFKINAPPQGGSFSINPLNGTTTTVFNIACSNWQDADGIQDYSFYDFTQRMTLAYSLIPSIEIRLPTGDNITSSLYIVVQIRDLLNSITEFNISSTVFVQSDTEQINNFINFLQNSLTNITCNPYFQVLSSNNQNAVSQVIHSLSQEFNKINIQQLQTVAANGIPIATITVSALDSTTQQQDVSSIPFNASALAEYNKQLHIYANLCRGISGG
ncbi:unnamed protein product, partial [Rotaria magnacalcarata]